VSNDTNKILTIDEKLEICRITKRFSSESLTTVFNELFTSEKPISEAQIRDKWLNNLRLNSSFFPEGWYSPPPYGISVLIGKNGQKNRTNFKSLRPEEMWSKPDINLDKKNSILACYASPVDKQTGIIGDFGLTLYFGKDPKIIKHLRTCYEIYKNIFNFIEVGKKFSEVYQYTQKQIKKNGLKSDLSSPSDPTGTNIGHSIPGVYDNWSKEEIKTLLVGDKDWNAIKNMISKKRTFVNSQEDTKYQPGMAVTLEPRPYSDDDPNIPMVWFHTTILIKPDGSKEALTYFEDLFKIVGMNYMLF